MHEQIGSAVAYPLLANVMCLARQLLISPTSAEQSGYSQYHDTIIKVRKRAAAQHA